MKCWPRRVTSLAEVPEPFRQPFCQLPLDGAEFPLVLFSPAFRYDWFERSPKLLISTGRRLFCLEDARHRLRQIELSLDDVHTAEWGNALLHSWLRFDAHGAQGAVTLQVDFNAVCRDLYRPLLQEFLRGVHSGSVSDLAQECSRFDDIRYTEYKFMNYARYALEPGARVQDFFLQRRVTERRWKVLRRVLVPGCLLIATDRELIVVREGDGDDRCEYAGIWTHLRLDRMERLDTRRRDDEEIAEVNIVMPAHQPVAVRYAVQNDGPVQRLLEGLRGGMGSIPNGHQ